MAKPHDRRHQKLDTPEQRKTNHKGGVKRRMNWWHFPLYKSSGVEASHPGASMFMQVKALNWIGQETGEVTYTPLELGGLNGSGCGTCQ